MNKHVTRVLRAVDSILSREAWAGEHPVLALRLVLVLVFVGVVVAQTLVFPMLAADLASSYPEATSLRWPLLIMVIVGLAMVQVAIACIGRLLTVVAESTAFSRDALRYVDGIVVAGTVATVLALAAMVVQVATEMLQPGLMLVTMAAVVCGAGITLLVVVLRALLVRAVALDEETDALHAELGEVI
ncbi:DUF2975 domain-containing protein [Xylanimonas protaetiae]|uniref:DUF2975 domain-containing protein n=1 Tax=Xylanimonas protaetiae TaxID=2509457 RepID=A0A4V0YGI1_9MICO|nr:DUF2975 domain-containing protein [Xylanimonas protaetiae]QAY71291.1 DUF2975 domain-containing protein [Xylanimonas protaetiae]